MTTTGHEDEFRRLFAQEADERLAALTRDLLALEEGGNDSDLVASVFRDAHTLKGGAAVVGLEEVRLVAHAMEGLLEQLRSGTRLPTPDLIDSVLAAVDGVKELLPSVLEGEDQIAKARAIERSLQAMADGVPAPALADDEAPVEENGGPAPAVPVGPRVHAVTDAEVVRVPLARLDELVRLVGESASANLRFGRLLSERLGVDPAAIDEVRDLSRVLNELQERTMRVRMVPVATITDGLQRAVRDVSRSTGKDVRWEVRGEDTELDRGVLQQLSDPLLHLVRNAVDHGIESPAERAAVGKPEQAVVRLHAMQLGSEVIVTITDDGRGIDVDRVRAKATSARC